MSPRSRLAFLARVAASFQEVSGVALVLSIVLALAPVARTQDSTPRREAGARPAPVVSPQVLEDRRITFRLVAPKASSVRFTGGDIPGVGGGQDLKKGEGQGDGAPWEITLGPVPPGAYRYRFDVDGVATMDPRNPSISESNNDAWSLVYVPGSPITDTRDVPHGALAEVTYFSKSLGRFRRMHVYTPPGYETGTEKYPIFYLLHGASDSDASWSTVGRAGFILDNLIADGKAKPMVMVMPAGHTGPFGFGRRDGGGRNEPRRDEFAEDLVGDIMPYAESRYRVLADRAHRAMAGLSMGGGQTLNIGIAHLEKFAYLGVYSSGVFGITGQGRGNDSATPRPSWEEQNKEKLDDPELKKGLELLWFATGKEDFLLETSRATVKMLQAHGFNVTYEESEGGHTWLNWRQYLPTFAQLLFGGTGAGVGTPADAKPLTSDASAAGTGSNAGVAGKWTAEFDTQIGVQKYVFTLAVDGSKVTGKAASEIQGEKRESKLSEGVVEGGVIRFVETLDFQGNPLRIEYSGKVLGEELQLTRKVGDFVTEELVAKRAAK